MSNHLNNKIMLNHHDHDEEMQQKQEEPQQQRRNNSSSQRNNSTLSRRSDSSSRRLVSRRSTSRLHALRSRCLDPRINKRLIHRDLTHDQSRNQLKIVNKSNGRYHRGRWCLSRQWQFLLKQDWFHVALRWPTWFSLFVWISAWTLMIVVFAGIYVLVDSRDPTVDCGLGNGQSGETIEYNAAFAFSLETCTTVGYGLPGSTNAFFENCPGLQFVIYIQMLYSMVFNAFLLAFFFARVGRSETRGIQVLFGRQAICKLVDGQWIFQARVYDVDAPHPVVEAHVRLYAANLSWQGELQPMRIVKPNDDLGAVLFTSVPTTVTHVLDAYSPLSPPPHQELKHFINSKQRQGFELRQFDGTTGNRDDYECPVCGETYGTFDRLERHVRYQQVVEEHDEYPPDKCHLQLPPPEQFQQFRPQPPSLDEIKEYVSHMEILCVVEGIDPLTSGTFQGLQSYTSEDIRFGSGSFAPCVSHENDKLVVDLDSFHVIEEKES